MNTEEFLFLHLLATYNSLACDSLSDISDEWLTRERFLWTEEMNLSYWDVVEWFNYQIRRGNVATCHSTHNLLFKHQIKYVFIKHPSRYCNLLSNENNSTDPNKLLSHVSSNSMLSSWLKEHAERESEKMRKVIIGDFRLAQMQQFHQIVSISGCVIGK